MPVTVIILVYLVVAHALLALADAQDVTIAVRVVAMEVAWTVVLLHAATCA